MFHSIKRFVALFILVGLVGSLPSFARPLVAGKPGNPETFTIELPAAKTSVSESKAILIGANHSYKLNLKPGQRVEFVLRSNKALNLNVKAPSGAVNQNKSQKEIRGVLTGEGEFVIDVSANDFSFYTLEVKSK